MPKGEKIEDNIIYTLMIGVISGLISSFVYFIALRRMKPKLIVAMSVICEKTEDQYRYSVKVVNKTRAALTNVYYSLQFHNGNSSGIVNIEHIKPSKEILHHIEKYSLNMENDEYAVRLSFSDKQKHDINNVNSYLVFTIYATHSVSGRTVYSQVKYPKNKIIINGIYETGLSTKVLGPN